MRENLAGVGKGGFLSSGPEAGAGGGDGAGGQGGSTRALMSRLRRLGFILEVVGTLD